MSELSELLLGICTASAVGGIIHLISPSGNMGKSVKTAVTLFMLVSICISFKTAWRNTDISVYAESEEIYKEAGELIEENVRETVRQTVEEILKSRGFDFSKIEAETYITADNELLVKTVRIYGIKDGRIRETEDEISEKTGAEVQFVEAR